jgi:hypothetical protein
MANGTIAFDTLTTSDSVNTNTEKSIDTSYIFNGVAKVFMRAPGNKESITESFNVSSLDDDGTGDFGINYTNNFATTSHFPMAHIPSGVVAGNSDGHFCECNSSATSAGEYQAWYGDASTNATFIDWQTAHATFGELA